MVFFLSVIIRLDIMAVITSVIISYIIYINPYFSNILSTLNTPPPLKNLTCIGKLNPKPSIICYLQPSRNSLETTNYQPMTFLANYQLEIIPAIVRSASPVIPKNISPAFWVIVLGNFCMR